MARMPFNRYLARIVGETPAPYVIEAMEWLWGEDAIRQTVRKSSAHRVCNFYRYVRRAFRHCDEVIGQKLLVDEGQTSVVQTYGIGHVYVGGIVKRADVVIVESAKGKRSLAFEVDMVRGPSRFNGRYVPRMEDTFIVVSLPHGDRGNGKEQEHGRIADSRGRGRNRDPWDTSSRRSASSFSGAARGHGRKAGG